MAHGEELEQGDGHVPRHGPTKIKTMDPEKNSMTEPKPNALYAATRPFVIDSGASYHLIGYNQLTEKEKGSIRPIKVPFRIQSANGIIIVDKEVHIFVPALNVSVWAQLMQDCPAVLSLGILCSRQGWTYEWQTGKNPTLSKGSRRITLTPHHDVPMVFAARLEQVEIDIADNVELAENSATVESSEGDLPRPAKGDLPRHLAKGDLPQSRKEGVLQPPLAKGDLLLHQVGMDPQL